MAGAIIAVAFWLGILLLGAVTLDARRKGDVEMAEYIELTIREMTALMRAGEIIAAGFEHAGCDLTCTELPDGVLGPAPLLSALMKLETAAAIADADWLAGS